MVCRHKPGADPNQLCLVWDEENWQGGAERGPAPGSAHRSLPQPYRDRISVTQGQVASRSRLCGTAFPGTHKGTHVAWGEGGSLHVHCTFALFPCPSVWMPCLGVPQGVPPVLWGRCPSYSSLWDVAVPRSLVLRGCRLLPGVVRSPQVRAPSQVLLHSHRWPREAAPLPGLGPSVVPCVDQASPA